MSDINLGLQAIAREPENHPIVKRFLRFFGAIALLPVLVYFLVLNVAPPGLLALPITAGIAAVLTLNILTASFAILAVKEPSPPVPVRVEGEGEEDNDNVSAERPKRE